MIEIELDAIPNQSLSINLDSSQYDITIKETNGIMSATIVRNNTVILRNARIVAGCPLIPYLYLELGNFMFVTNNDDFPYYTEFGVTQFLIYASEAELGAIRAGT